MNIDWSVWELQEPVGTPGNPTTISSKQLQNGYQDQYFFPGTQAVSQAATQVSQLTQISQGFQAFKDPGDPATSGCVTTPNSTHCRTELREVNPSDGSAASWTPTGTNKLDATLAVIAAGGNVAIGQIHFADSVSTKLRRMQFGRRSENIQNFILCV
jgi:hypothetical protein